MKIWTDDECIEVEPNDVGQLEAAMLFKAERIKAKADPELFAAVADMLSRLWDSTTKRVDVVRCRECKHFRHYGKTSLFINGKNIKAGWCQRRISYDEEYRMTADDFCSYAERKEGADNG